MNMIWKFIKVCTCREVLNLKFCKFSSFLMRKNCMMIIFTTFSFYKCNIIHHFQKGSMLSTDRFLHYQCKLNWNYLVNLQALCLRFIQGRGGGGYLCNLIPINVNVNFVSSDLAICLQYLNKQMWKERALA